MKRLAVLTPLALLLLWLAAAGSPAAAQQGQTGPGVRYDPDATFEVAEFDVEYRRDGATPLLARVYQPQGPGPFPALLWAHGGAWTVLDRTSNAAMNRALAASGLVVAALDFRQGAADPYPSSLVDLNDAARWLRADADRFRVDPRAIGGFGGSSGAHLLLLGAMRPSDPRYAALALPEAPQAAAALRFLVLGYPISDPEARYRFAQDTGNTRLVASHDGYWRTVEAMCDGNPQLILERREPVPLPQLLVLQGTSDDNYPFELQQRFVDTYRGAGGAVQFEVFPDTGHSFFDPGPGSPAGVRAIALTKAFVASQLAAGARQTAPAPGPRGLPRTGTAGGAVPPAAAGGVALLVVGLALRRGRRPRGPHRGGGAHPASLATT